MKIFAVRFGMSSKVVGNYNTAHFLLSFLKLICVNCFAFVIKRGDGC